MDIKYIIDKESIIARDMERLLHDFYQVNEDLKNEIKRDNDLRPLGVYCDRVLRAISGFRNFLRSKKNYSKLLNTLEEIKEEELKRIEYANKKKEERVNKNK
jgi:hypothetical protein